MKIQSKILSMALVPLLCLGIFTVIVGDIEINNVVTDTIENGLRASAVSVRDTLDNVSDGTYSVEGDQLYKGEYNVTEAFSIADNIKTAADMDITVFYGDTRYMTSVKDASGSRVLLTQAGEAVVQKVLNGGSEYFSTDVLVEGTAYFGYYVPLLQDGSVVGMIFAGMPQADAKAQINTIIIAIASAVIAIILIVAVIVVIASLRMSKAIGRGAESLEKIAKGKLNIELHEGDLKRKDEIGNINRAIQALKQELTEIVVGIKGRSDELNTSAQLLDDQTYTSAEHITQVERAVEEIAQGAGGQAEETQKATENVILMGNMVEETTAEINALNENSRQIKELGQTAIESLKDLQKINQRTRESIDVIYEQTNTTNTSAQKIKEATELITDIAEETNLLSLNASIEAARAGEQGRGFAVVAGQIQKLAEQSNDSARQIDEIINLLLSDSAKAVETMEEVKVIMEQQNANVKDTDRQVNQVLDQVEQSIEAIGRVAEKTDKIDDARISVTDTVQNLTAVAEENAASTEESAASVNQVSEIIQEIAENARKQKAISEDLKASMQMFEI